MERAWIEYAHTDGLKVKAGKFLPPFGFYNVFHDATPAFLSTFLPAAVYGKHSNTTGSSQRLFSKFGTGVQVLGTGLGYYVQASYATNLRLTPFARYDFFDPEVTPATTAIATS